MYFSCLVNLEQAGFYDLKKKHIYIKHIYIY